MDKIVNCEVRRIDDLGRIVIPKWMRQELGISEGDALELTLLPGGIFINAKDKLPFEE